MLWDEFTHPRRWGTEHVPALAATWDLLPGDRWLHYATNLIGALVLLAWFVAWWGRTPPRPERPPPGRWWAWGLLAATGATAGGLAALTAPSIGAAGSPARPGPGMD